MSLDVSLDDRGPLAGRRVAGIAVGAVALFALGALLLQFGSTASTAVGLSLAMAGFVGVGVAVVLAVASLA